MLNTKEDIIRRIKFDEMLIKAYTPYPYDRFCKGRLKSLTEEVKNLKSQLQEESVYR